MKENPFRFTFFVKKYSFILSLILILLVHQLLQKVLKINHLWIDSYLDDLLAIPLIMGISLIIERELLAYVDDYRHSIPQIIFTYIVVTFCFEYLFPRISEMYISDPMDIVCYTFGAFIYYLWQKNKDSQSFNLL